MHGEVFYELKQLLLESLTSAELLSSTDGDVCTAEECISVEAEPWTKASVSDDDENPLSAVREECNEPSGQDAREDVSSEVQMTTLNEAQAQ